MVKAGEYVLYGSAGVCRVASFEEKNFDGVHTNEYCRLDPVFAENSVYYVPSASVEGRVRNLLSRDEILSIIKRMPATDPLSITDGRNKKEIFDSILKSGDYSLLVPMMKLLHNEKQARSSSGRKLNSSDQRAMHDAQELMCQEFSVVLNIDKSEVMQYIENAVGAEQ